MEKALIIYDLNGTVWNVFFGLQTPPEGIPYIEVEIPEGANVSRIDIQNKNVIVSYEDGHEEAIYCEEIGGSIPSSDIEKEITTYNRGDLSFNADYGICLKIPKAGYYSADKYLYCPLSFFGDADGSSVLKGRSFTSKEGIRIEGRLSVASTESKAGIVYVDPIRKRLFLSMPQRGYYDASSGIYCSYDELLEAIGITPEMVRDDCHYLDRNGLAKCIDSIPEDESIIFDEIIPFTDNTWDYENDGADSLHVRGIDIDTDAYDGSVLLEIGVMDRDQFRGGTVIVRADKTCNQIVMLPVSGANNYFHTYVNLVITRNNLGNIYIKGLKGDESGEYRLRIKKLARTNAL